MRAKKIGFLSAIILVISSCIGAGIFFKSNSILNNVHQNLTLAIIAWVIAAIGVIAMALALVEMSNNTNTKNNDKGLMEWNKVFNKKIIYYGCKNFMTFIYMPITYFFMPVYAMQSILDALDSFGINVSGVPWWSIMLLSFLISGWFIISSGYSSKIANVQNWIATLVKFIPLLAAMIIGFVIFGKTNVLPSNLGSNTTTYASWNLFGISPAFGMFTSLSAIFFAYDGFYIVCGISSQMKEPKKTPLALLIGLLIVTFIYLMISISCMIGNDSGDWTGFKNFFKSKNLLPLYGTISLLITFAIFGIINSYAIWSPRFIESLIKDDELFKWTSRFKNKLNPDRPKIGIYLTLLTTFPIILIFSIIGALGYIPLTSYDNVNLEVCKLYNFADLSSTWTAILIFSFICIAIFGALRNRFSKKIPIHNKTKYFIPSAIISIVIIFSALLFEFINPFFNLFSMINQINNGNYIDQNTIIGTVMLVVVLFLIMFLTFIPTIWDFKYEKYNLKLKQNIFKIEY